MSFIKDVGNFFTKEIPKFVTKTVPSVFEPETYAPDLVPLRKTVDALKADVTRARERFYTEKSATMAAHTRYLRLSEDFKATGKSFTQFNFYDVRSLIRRVSATEKTARDIAKVSRTLSGVVTLGLAELIYVHADIEEERRTLNRQRAILTGTRKRFDKGIAELVAARKLILSQVQLIEKELADAGIEVGPSAASELTATQAEDIARREMAARLLGLGTDADTIMSLTGLSQDQIDAIPPVDDEEDDDAAVMITKEEQHLLSELRG